MQRIHAFREYLIQEEKGELTIEKYTQDARRFLCWLGQKQLMKYVVLAYKAELISQYAVASVNSKLSSVNCFLKFIGRGDCCVKTVKEPFCRKKRNFQKKSILGFWAQQRKNLDCAV